MKASLRGSPRAHDFTPDELRRLLAVRRQSLLPHHKRAAFVADVASARRTALRWKSRPYSPAAKRRENFGEWVKLLGLRKSSAQPLTALDVAELTLVGLSTPDVLTLASLVPNTDNAHADKAQARPSVRDLDHGERDRLRQAVGAASSMGATRGRPGHDPRILTAAYAVLAICQRYRIPWAISRRGAPAILLEIVGGATGKGDDVRRVLKAVSGSLPISEQIAIGARRGKKVGRRESGPDGADILSRAWAPKSRP